MNLMITMNQGITCIKRSPTMKADPWQYPTWSDVFKMVCLNNDLNHFIANTTTINIFYTNTTITNTNITNTNTTITTITNTTITITSITSLSWTLYAFMTLNSASWPTPSFCLNNACSGYVRAMSRRIT